jgi:hypothetical protein
VKWKPNAKGNCSAKEAFKLLNAQVQVQLPTQGARGIGDHAMEILERVWAHKLLPPNIKTFVWRLIRRAIATGARAGNPKSVGTAIPVICLKMTHICFSTALLQGRFGSLPKPLCAPLCFHLNRMEYRKLLRRLLTGTHRTLEYKE